MRIVERMLRCLRALENMERFGLPKHIVAFVLPTGYSFNLDGSTLYLSLAAIFVAQAGGVTVLLTTLAYDAADADADEQGGGGGSLRASLADWRGRWLRFNLPMKGVAGWAWRIR